MFKSYDKELFCRSSFHITHFHITDGVVLMSYLSKCSSVNERELDFETIYICMLSVSGNYAIKLSCRYKTLFLQYMHIKFRFYYYCIVVDQFY